MLERLNKLKGRSTVELLVRGRQAISAFSERHGVSSQTRLPTDREFHLLLDVDQFSDTSECATNLLARFRSGSSSKFFAAFDDPESTVQLHLEHFDKSRLVEQADSIVKGSFDLLGLRGLNFGQPIDWHLEPVSGKSSPLVHWSRIHELDSDGSGDKKIVWELNRHQYFSKLGRAFWITDDAQYAETFVSHLEQWMESNPPNLGLNWVSSLEVSFRAISWLWGLQFFRGAMQVTPELYVRVLKYLYLHGRHLETYLSTYSSPNTHLTGEALGLFYLGTMLREFKAAARWRDQGRRILTEEVMRHVLDDGVYFERSSYYHRYTTEFYTHFVILSERSGQAIDDGVRAKLKSLMDHLMYITRPDGTTPFYGDDDGGQLAVLDVCEVNDFRPLLSIGASLFGRADYKFVAGNASESTLWLLGREGMRAFDELPKRLPAMESCEFPVGGYYVMRDGWSKDSNYLLFDCGPHGILNCGHAHADALSFDLSSRGRTMLVDPGTFAYNGSKELRDGFRSSAAHNTLTIDGESSSVPAGPFSWKEIANASVHAWKSEKRFDFIQGEHDGYKCLDRGPAIHARSVLFLKGDYWVMRDAIETNGSHEYEQHFHFAAGTQPVLKSSEGNVSSPVENPSDQSGLQLFSFSEKGEWRIDDGWVSKSYGERTSAPVCTFSVSGKGAHEIQSFLLPQRANEACASVKQIEATGGRAFRIERDRFCDVMVFGSGATVEVELISSDFKWTWARFAKDGGMLEELVLIAGRSFSFDGEAILKSTEHIDYAVARRAGDKLVIEIVDQKFEVVFLESDSVIASRGNRDFGA